MNLETMTYERDGRIARITLDRAERGNGITLAMPRELAINQSLFAQGLQGTQSLSVFFDGIARHTPEGYEFQRQAGESGYRDAVRDRDEPFEDFGLDK